MKEDKKVKILQDVLAIPTENDNEEEYALYLKDLFEEYDIKSKIIEYAPGRSNIIAELKGKNPGKVLTFAGHLDVVDAGDHEQWDYPPFSGEIHDGWMYGRGASDMKSGTTALAIALCEIKEKDIEFDGTIRYVGNVAEEVGMHGSQQIQELGYMEDVDGIIVGEPSDETAYVAHKGSILYEVSSKGAPAHSSTPEAGINAITQLTDFIMEIEKRFGEAHNKYENEQLGRPTNAFCMINGGNQPNTVPDQASVIGSIRPIPEFINEDCIQLFQDVIDEKNKVNDGKLSMEVTFNAYPVESSYDSDLVKSLNKTVHEPVEITTFSACTDASFYTKDRIGEIDVLIYGPGYMEDAHRINEKVPVELYLDFIEQYQNIAMDYLS